MVRLKPTVAFSLPLALFGVGCSGQKVEGRWLGAFPLREAKNCQIQLLNTSRFSVACDGTAIVAAGRYRWNGKTLTLDTQILTFDGDLEQAKPQLAFDVEGHGNSMKLYRMGETFEWKRAYR
ncbi:MAG TPA: hypothetical protein VG944_17355 [Fimbriimonas sp.]|nr:hypothetical protein [Fimbriimonas sp.]